MARQNIKRTPLGKDDIGERIEARKMEILKKERVKSDVFTTCKFLKMLLNSKHIEHDKVAS